MEQAITKDDTEETLEQLMAQITDEKKLAFLEQYPRFNTTVGACEAVGISEHTPYNWRDRDGAFSTAFTALKKRITQRLIEEHEKNIDDVAFDHDTPAQSRIFGSLVKLRAYDPDRYREKSVTETKLTGNITVKMAIPRPTDPQITVEEPIQIGEKKE